MISGIAANGKPELQILDALGREVTFSSQQEGDQCRITFQQNIASGLYMLRIRTEGGVAVYRLDEE